MWRSIYIEGWGRIIPRRGQGGRRQVVGSILIKMVYINRGWLIREYCWTISYLFRIFLTMYFIRITGTPDIEFIKLTEMVTVFWNQFVGGILPGIKPALMRCKTHNNIFAYDLCIYYRHGLNVTDWHIQNLRRQDREDRVVLDLTDCPVSLLIPFSLAGLVKNRCQSWLLDRASSGMLCGIFVLNQTVVWRRIAYMFTIMSLNSGWCRWARRQVRMGSHRFIYGWRGGSVRGDSFFGVCIVGRRLSSP